MIFAAIRPPRIAMALTFIATTLHWSLNIWEPVRFSLPRTGAFVGSAGFLLMMWSWMLFKRRHIPVCVTGTSGHIATSGPYRFSRNPMYLGMVLMLLGLALHAGTPPFYVSTLAYFAILNFFICPYEESKLSRAFGEEYLRYRSRVRRWL